MDRRPENEHIYHTIRGGETGNLLVYIHGLFWSLVHRLYLKWCFPERVPGNIVHKLGLRSNNFFYVRNSNSHSNVTVRIRVGGAYRGTYWRRKALLSKLITYHRSGSRDSNFGVRTFENSEKWTKSAKITPQNRYFYRFPLFIQRQT